LVIVAAVVAGLDDVAIAIFFESVK